MPNTMNRTLKILAFAVLAALAVACGPRRKAPAQDAAPEALPSTYTPPEPPAHLTVEGRRDYLRYHYWDRFDFADTLFIRRADTIRMYESFGLFIALISDRPADAAPVDSLMRRASVSRPMLDYFAMLAEEVLHNPNSPLRNDEYYIPVLEAQLRAPWYDEYERIAPEYDLHMVSQNRPGHPANDIRYTTASGRTERLYDLRAEYVLVFFMNPDCPMCRALREEISASPMLNELIEQGRLKVLSLYPDEDLEAWRAHRGEIPATWINAYDAGCVIRDEATYDLRAIPSLYLLDSRKRVVVKDAAGVEPIEEAIDRRS